VRFIAFGGLAALALTLAPIPAASHPLDAVLAQYDREIAALRATLQTDGLRDPAAEARRGAAAVQRDGGTAAARATNIGNGDDARNRARERNAIAQAAAFEREPASGFAASSSQLAAETNANLRAFGGAMTERTQRAYAERAAQLRERESTLAYTLERRDASRRLSLRLRLEDLHLTPAGRRQALAQLAALDAGERNAVDAMQRADAATLAAYGVSLQRDAAATNATMDSRFRSTASANDEILRRAFHEASNGGAIYPSQARLVSFERGYDPRGSASAIADGMRAAAADAAVAFTQLAATDEQSRREVESQLAVLEADRAALYRSIVASESKPSIRR